MRQVLIILTAVLICLAGFQTANAQESIDGKYDIAVLIRQLRDSNINIPEWHETADFGDGEGESVRCVIGQRREHDRIRVKFHFREGLQRIGIDYELSAYR